MGAEQEVWAARIGAVAAEATSASKKAGKLERETPGFARSWSMLRLDLEIAEGAAANLVRELGEVRVNRRASRRVRHSQHVWAIGGLALGYCQWRNRAQSDRACSNAALDAAVSKLHPVSRRSYGRPRSSGACPSKAASSES
jgi:hypothetical protein